MLSSIKSDILVMTGALLFLCLLTSAASSSLSNHRMQERRPVTIIGNGARYLGSPVSYSSSPDVRLSGSAPVALPLTASHSHSPSQVVYSESSKSSSDKESAPSASSHAAPPSSSHMVATASEKVQVHTPKTEGNQPEVSYSDFPGMPYKTYPAVPSPAPQQYWLRPQHQPQSWHQNQMWAQSRQPLQPKPRSFLETVFSFIPTLISFFGIGAPGGTALGGFSFAEEIFRMLGFDSSRMGLYALNALVFVAEKIANRFLNIGNEVEARSAKDNRGFIERITDTTQVSNFLQSVQNKELPETLIQNIGNTTGARNSACAQRLVCKMSPVIWGLQRSVNDLFPTAPTYGPAINIRTLNDWVAKYMPSHLELSSYSDLCDNRFPSCYSSPTSRRRS